jgi:hypothetical protein
MKSLDYQLKILMILCVAFVACSKKYPKMKPGYYHVIDKRVFQNGDSLILNFKSLGTYSVNTKSNKEYRFTSIQENRVVPYNFNFEQNTSYDYSDSTLKIRYNIKDFKITPTELVVTRREVSDSFISKIHFKYIE